MLDKSITMTRGLAEQIKNALEGDTHDAEHYALVTVAQHFGIKYDPDAAYDEED